MTPEQARAALAESDRRALDVRNTDSGVRSLLVAVAATYLGGGAAMAFATRDGSPLPIVAAVAIFAAGSVVMVNLARGIRAYSRDTNRRMWLYAAVFYLWNLTVLVLSIFGGWLLAQPHGWHFTVTLAVIAVPPLLAALLMTQRGR